MPTVVCTAKTSVQENMSNRLAQRIFKEDGTQMVTFSLNDAVWCEPNETRFFDAIPGGATRSRVANSRVKNRGVIQAKYALHPHNGVCCGIAESPSFATAS